MVVLISPPSVTTTTTVSTAVCACPSGAVVVNVCGISVVISGACDGAVLVEDILGVKLEDEGGVACEADEDADDAGTELGSGEREE